MIHNAILWTGRSKSTVIDWYNLCRDVVVDQFSKRSKMGDPGHIVQVDESLSQLLIENENIIAVAYNVMILTDDHMKIVTKLQMMKMKLR